MKLSGVMPALVTPFGKDGKVDFKAMEKLMHHLRDAGVTSMALLSGLEPDMAEVKAQVEKSFRAVFGYGSGGEHESMAEKRG